jgi:hypothetical protein
MLPKVEHEFTKTFSKKKKNDHATEIKFTVHCTILKGTLACSQAFASKRGLS